MKWVVVALVGAVTCTVLDHLHATHGVLFYPQVSFWDQAWWVPLLFACASVAIVAGAGVTRKLLDGPPLERPTPREIAGDAVAFVAAYAFTSFAHALPDALLAVLVAFWLARVLRGNAPPWLIAYSLLVGAGGTMFEAAWSGLGFFHYHHPDMVGVPRWLPGIYLHVAFLTADLQRLLAAT